MPPRAPTRRFAPPIVAVASAALVSSCTENVTEPPVPGGRIVFERRRGTTVGLTIAGSDGADVVELAAGGEERPAWGPEGAFIAYQRANLGTYTDIFFVRVRGLEETRVTSSIALSERDPSWSPDGTRLVYSGEFFTDGLPKADSIVIANVVGGGSSAITTGRDPSWGPGGRIAFVDRTSDESDLPAVWILDSDFRRRRATSASSEPASELEPSFASNGQLAWTRMRQVNRAQGTVGAEWSIMVQSTAGAEPVAIITDSVEVRAPSWSPDGTYLVVTASWRGRPEIWAIRADGDPGTRRRISSAAGCSTAPCADANAVWTSFVGTSAR